MKYILMILMSALLSCGVETNVYSTESFMEENNLWMEDGITSSYMTETEFNNIVKEFENIYKPIFSQLGRTLSFELKWSDSTVNAYNSTQGNRTVITLMGGLPRRSEVTYDGFRMVICHEIGHTLAGYPYYSGTSASNEGQSDYFSSNACGKVFFGKMKEYKQMLNNAWAKKYCDQVETTVAKQAMCYRVMMAGKSLGNLLGVLNGSKPNFSTPDTTQVSKMSDSHPKAQCRLDTYMVGTTCAKVWPTYRIPANRTEEQNTQCAKPKCWYK